MFYITESAAFINPVIRAQATLILLSKQMCTYNISYADSGNSGSWKGSPWDSWHIHSYLWPWLHSLSNYLPLYSRRFGPYDSPLWLKPLRRGQHKLTCTPSFRRPFISCRSVEAKGLREGRVGEQQRRAGTEWERGVEEDAELLVALREMESWGLGLAEVWKEDAGMRKRGRW